ncbi:MAG: SLC13 family permease, partial [Acidimicrobiia bacterium]
MSWEAWLTLAVAALAVLVMARDLVPPAAAVFSATVVLLVAGVVTPAQAFSGFSNPAPVTVAALYVLAGAVEKTGALTPLVATALGDGRDGRRSLARIMVPTAGASAFLNNTPIVAMLVPAVTGWADRNDKSVSRYLMPLSFAAILGGTVTVIGTSTNVVVSGLLEASDRDPIRFFEMSKVGLPLAVVGIAVILFLSPKALPVRRAARRNLDENVREFVVDMVVEQRGPLDGVSVEEGGLRHLRGVFLVQLERARQLIAPVAPSTELRGDDRLRFVGDVNLVVDLHNTRGLVPAVEDQLEGFDTSRLAFFEAVVGAASPLVGRTLQGIRFRGRYQAAVVAIHRAGQRIEAKLGEVPLRLGDTLLVLADPGFRSRWSDRGDFLLISRLGDAEPARSGKARVVALVGGAVILAAALDVLSILEASLLGALAVVVLGVLTPGEARSAVNLDVLVVIASSFGLGAAIETTGLAERLADGLTTGLEGLGPTAVLLGVVLATVALTELITNNAAAVLVFPIAVSAAAALGSDPRGFAIAVALASSASFLTPIGYQTNTMVWGPGGYRFGDYARLGFPVTVVVVTA